MASEPVRLLPELWPAYTDFHREMIATGDVDPVYPVLREMAARRSPQRALWLVLAHVAYYHLGSTLAAFSAVRDTWDAGMAPADLPVATERRGHRDRRKLVDHLNSLQRNADAILFWTRDLPADPHEAWRLTVDRLMTIHGNGRWAAFKTAEMFQQVLGLPLLAPDMAHAHSSGPRQGLRLLWSGLPTGNDRAAVALLDRFSLFTMVRLREAGLEATVENTETTLCDFHSLVIGRYYVGADIDKMQLQLDAVPDHGYEITGEAYAARAKTLPHAYLGELHGRTGPDRIRSTAFRTQGLVVTR
jgi:hypothetical protein